MLKQISRSLCAIALLTSMSVLPVSAGQDSMEKRRLEGQIQELKSEIRELKATTLEMQKLLQAVAIEVLQDKAAAVIGASEQSSCEYRLNELVIRRSELEGYGFSARHPDIVNITGNIEKTQQECAALNAARQQ